ncbi:DNA cytosine methyltransferase [Acinetobacter baumannii]|nr:DNA cytosine methyltransferase [Acinetobacter baumannii]RYL30526.1 DNA cytosine methyltransferase [Acinetobacter baumannii]RYL44461.1 DNA cytosine methyltransferase [Acinetobacter baumannii]
MHGNSMIGIDLFSGAGGLSLGAIYAGVNVKYAVELDKYAAITCSRNHLDTKVLNEDIRLISASNFELIDVAKTDLILFGGPPCQGFSTSNQKNRNKDNSKNWLFKEYLRIARELEPNWIIIENVKGLLETENRLFYNAIISELNYLGYTISTLLLNASDYGIPQNRNRIFIIGSKKGKIVKKPQKNLKYINVKEALWDLPDIDNGHNISEMSYQCEPHSEYATLMRTHTNETVCNNLVTRNSSLILERYKYIPQGGNWENIPENLMTNYADRSRCHTGIYRRLEESKPAVTIGNFRKNMLVHPWKHRGLSIREAARLQSFPDDFIFYGSIGFQQQQVGNAVPPLLAKVIFNQILESC